MEKIWFRGNPRLWYRPDLENHPELIPLEGQEVVLPRGSTLSKLRVVLCLKSFLV